MTVSIVIFLGIVFGFMATVLYWINKPRDDNSSSAEHTSAK